MIPIQKYLQSNKTDIKRILPTGTFSLQHEKNILKKYEQLKANCKRGELIGFSYNYINNTIKSGLTEKDKAVNKICKLLNLNQVDIIKGKTCLYIYNRR